MSIQLALLKSGEEVIADIKEIRQEETDVLVSYFFKDPYCVKIKTTEILVEEESRPKHELAYYKWMSLSNDSDIIVRQLESKIKTGVLGLSPILNGTPPPKPDRNWFELLY